MGIGFVIGNSWGRMDLGIICGIIRMVHGPTKSEKNTNKPIIFPIP